MTVTNASAIAATEDQQPTMVESLEEAALILEEEPHVRVLIVPKGTIDAMVRSRLNEVGE